MQLVDLGPKTNPLSLMNELLQSHHPEFWGHICLGVLDLKLVSTLHFSLVLGSIPSRNPSPWVEPGKSCITPKWRKDFLSCLSRVPEKGLRRGGWKEWACEVDDTAQFKALQIPFVCGNPLPCMSEMGEPASKWGGGGQTVVAVRLKCEETLNHWPAHQTSALMMKLVVYSSQITCGSPLSGMCASFLEVQWVSGQCEIY